MTTMQIPVGPRSVSGFARPATQTVESASAGSTPSHTEAPRPCDLERELHAMFLRDAPRLKSVALRYLRNDADADDAVQDALFAAFRKRETFTGASSLSTWIHRILVNVCLMRLRSQSRRPTTSLDSLPAGTIDGLSRIDADVASAGADRHLLRAELRQQVHEAIGRLPEQHRTMIRLRDFEEFTTEQTAELLGIRPDCVKTRLHRARRALGRLLESTVDDELLRSA